MTKLVIAHSITPTNMSGGRVTRTQAAAAAEFERERVCSVIKEAIRLLEHKFGTIQIANDDVADRLLTYATNIPGREMANDPQPANNIVVNENHPGNEAGNPDDQLEEIVAGVLPEDGHRQEPVVSYFFL